MDWVITLNEEQNYGLVVTSGIADMIGSQKMGVEISMTMERANIKKVFIDHRNISSVSGGTFEVANRPKEFERFGGNREIRVAMIINETHQAFFRFLETVFVNRGFTFSIFIEKEPALEWLLS